MSLSLQEDLQLLSQQTLVVTIHPLWETLPHRVVFSFSNSFMSSFAALGSPETTICHFVLHSFRRSLWKTGNIARSLSGLKHGFQKMETWTWRDESGIIEHLVRVRSYFFVTPYVCSLSNQFPSFFFLRAIKYNKTHYPSQETKPSSLVQSISHSFHVTQQCAVVLRPGTPPHLFFPSDFKQEVTSQKPWGREKQFNETVCRTSHEGYNSFLQKPQCSLLLKFYLYGNDILLVIQVND